MDLRDAIQQLLDITGYKHMYNFTSFDDILNTSQYEVTEIDPQKSGYAIGQTEEGFEIINFGIEYNQCLRYYGIDGHPVLPIDRNLLAGILLAKRANERIYIDDLCPDPDSSGKSIVLNYLYNKEIVVPGKQSNVTVFDCESCTIDIEKFPVSGIKIVDCESCTIRISTYVNTPIMYMFVLRSSITIMGCDKDKMIIELSDSDVQLRHQK